MPSSQARGIVVEWARIRGSKLKIPPEWIPSGESLLNYKAHDLGLFFEKPEDGEALFAYFHESESESSYSKSSSAYSNFDKQEQLLAEICKLEERYKTNPDQKFLNAELRILCSRRGLPSYGNKSDLKQRLCSFERVAKGL